MKSQSTMNLGPVDRLGKKILSDLQDGSASSWRTQHDMLMAQNRDVTAHYHYNTWHNKQLSVQYVHPMLCPVIASEMLKIYAEI